MQFLVRLGIEKAANPDKPSLLEKRGVCVVMHQHTQDTHRCCKKDKAGCPQLEENILSSKL